MNLYIFVGTGMGAEYGIGTYIRELTVALRNSPINVCVVKLVSGKPQIQIEEIDNIRYLFIPRPVIEQRIIDSKKRDELYTRNVTYLLQLYIEDKNNLVFHLNYMEHKALADALKKTFDCKIVSVVHYLMSLMSLSGNIRKFGRIIMQNDEPTDNEELLVKKFFQKEKEMLHAADKIISLSHHTFNLLHQYFQIEKEKMVVINNGLTDTQVTMDKQMLRQKYDIPDIPVLLFVGRLDNGKGLAYAIKAFKKVLNTKDCHFIIAGSGTFDLFMKECEGIRMHVTWTGMIDRDELYDLYSLADIGIMPSLSEQCNYVAIEMMMHGLPMITSTAPGLAEMTEEGISSLQAPVIEHSERVEIDTNILAEKMLYLLQNPDERKRLGTNARKRYEEAYSMEVFRKNMLDFYRSLYA